MNTKSFKKGNVYKYISSKLYEGYYLVPHFDEDDYEEGYWYKDCHVIDALGNLHKVTPHLVRFDICMVEVVNEVPTPVQEFMSNIQGD